MFGERATYSIGRLPSEPPTFDLQSHSRFSDGALSPTEVVATAATAGVELFALSDHDSVDGVQEAADAARGHRLRLVPAVEISAIDQRHQDLHILGYLVDHHDTALRERLEHYRGDRERRATAMAQALRSLGFELDERVLEARSAQGKSIGRPHLAQAVVTHPANQARLATEQRTDPSAFLEGYLIEGRPAFRARQVPTVADAVSTIHDAGGVAVWAHPFWDIPDPFLVLETIARFQAIGMDGVECFYVTHTHDQVELVADRCAELGLLTTGSSDFHGPGHRQFSRMRAFCTYGRRPQLGPIG